MSLKNKHIEKNNDLNIETGKMISGSYISWDKSRDEVWLEMEKKMELNPPVAKKIMFSPWIRMAAAAVLTLLIGINAFMYLYTKTKVVPPGQHSSIVLPDNSLVKLNAQSTLKYRPLWWNISRKVKFEGEAYFEVGKGKKFEVASRYGNTIVLGTSFNIFARNSNYHVTCFTGKVKVIENINRKEVILSTGQKAIIDKESNLSVDTEINTGQVLSWTENRFSFTSAPLHLVFEEIGRQYNIRITIQENFQKNYTGTFVKHDSVEQTLNLVCKPFNLKFTRKSVNEYNISGEN